MTEPTATTESRRVVCVVGSLHYDVMVRAPYLPRLGETLIGDAWWWKLGGKGGNQAIAAARHGAAVALIGRVGDDDPGRRLRARLAEVGVDDGLVRTVGDGTGISVAIEEAAGDYAAVVVSGANRGIDPAQVADCREVIRDSRVLLLQNEIAPEADRAAAIHAREGGSTVVLNAAPARPLDGMAGLVDVLVVNAVEAEMLRTGPVTDLRTASAAAQTLRSLAPTTVVTGGSAGAAAAASDGRWAVPAHPVGQAQTHGAGDVFVGALAARLAADAPLEDALRYANAAAALHVSTPDADRDAIGPDDVWQLLTSR